MSENGTKIDPRVKRTRELLRQAMMDLLGEKTLNKITVQDIAARAEVNRATFYAHFEDKYALLNHTVHEAFQARLAEELLPEPDLCVENLRKLMLVVSSFIGQSMSHCLPSMQFNENAIMLMQVQVSLYETIREWMGATATSESSEIEAAARMLSWAIWGSVFQWSHDGRTIPQEEMVEQAVRLLMPMVQPFPIKVEAT